MLMEAQAGDKFYVENGNVIEHNCPEQGKVDILHRVVASERERERGFSAFKLIASLMAARLAHAVI